MPVAVFVVLLWALHAPLGAADRTDAVRIIGTALAGLVLASAAELGLALPWVILLVALPPVLLVATSLSRPPRPGPRPGR